jgi:hypothetical protein
MTTSTSTAGSTKTERSETAAPAEPAPSPELLEFLGEFADERGAWVDPLDLDDAEAAGDAAEPKDGGR